MTVEAITPSLTRQQLRTLTLAALGGALEFYDFVIFVFFAATMGAVFFPPAMPEWLRLVQTFGIFAAGYLARPLGGVVMAHFGDLLGRKRMFMLSIALMAIPTLLIGCLPTYATAGIVAPLLLLLLRMMQGAAIGGEAPGAWVFVSEHVAPRHRSLACGTLSAGLTGGILLGSLIAAGIGALLTDTQLSTWGWRVPFLIGGAFGLIAMRLRRLLHETPVFAELQGRKALASELPIKTVLRDHRGGVVLSMLLTWLLTAAVVVPLLMMPTLLQKVFGISMQSALLANSLAIVCTMLGNIVAGTAADRFGAGRVLVMWSVLLGVSFWLFYFGVRQDARWLYPSYALVGFSVGLTALVPSIAVSAFPPTVRFSGLSFSYNVAYAIFGGATPVLLTLALHANAVAPAYYIAAMALLGCALGLWVQIRTQPPGD
ncbi:MAG: MFS transporter [Lysobacteraceae bacterium]